MVWLSILILKGRMFFDCVVCFCALDGLLWSMQNWQWSRLYPEKRRRQQPGRQGQTPGTEGLAGLDLHWGW